MPAIIPPEHWAAWLGETPASLADLKALLKPYEGAMTMRPEKRPKQKKALHQGSLF
jgi:putative SOS response-associated peptidase YedK